jgi:hypothetical protein
VDGGVASIDIGSPSSAIFLLHSGPFPFAELAEYGSGDVVYISSRTTGYKPPPSVYIVSTNATTNVDYASGDSGTAKFTNQIMIDCEDDDDYIVDGGDSGSVVVAYINNVYKIIGLLFAGSTDHKTIYANRIEDVASTINIESWDGNIALPISSYGASFDGVCYHKIKTVKSPQTHVPEYIYGDCEECQNPMVVSFTDSTGNNLIDDIFEVPLIGGTTIEKSFYLWFDKNDPQDRMPKEDCADGEYTINNIRLSVSNLDGAFSGGTDEYGQECIDEKWISVRSDGMRTFYCDQMVDDNQSTFKPIGGGFTNAADYLSLGDMCPDSARRIFLKISVPEGAESDGAVFPKLVVQYNIENESSSSESSSSISSESVSESYSSSSSESVSKSSSSSSSESSLSSSSESSLSSSSESSLSSSSDSSSESKSSSSAASKSSSSSSSFSSLSSSSESSESVSSSSSSESSESVSSSSSSESSLSNSSSSESESSSSSLLPCLYANGDVFSDDFTDLTGWTGACSSGTTSEIDWFDGSYSLRIDVPASPKVCSRYQDLGTLLNDRYVLSVRMYIDRVGSVVANANNYVGILFSGYDGTNIWTFFAKFSTDGLFIDDGDTFNEVGTDEVDEDQWAEWTFDMNVASRDTATVDVYKDGSLIEAGVDMSAPQEAGEDDGFITLRARQGSGGNEATVYFDFIEVGTGCEDSWSLPSDSSESESSSSSESESSSSSSSSWDEEA